MKRAWTAGLLVVLGTAFLVVAYVGGAGSGSLEALRVVPPIVAAVAVAVVAARSHPARPVPWAMLSVGFVGLAVATAFQSWNLHQGELVFPGDHEALVLLAYPALVAGMVGLTSPRRQQIDVLAGTEPIIYTIAVAALVWVAFSGPYFDGDGFPLAAGVWVVAIPLVDGLLALLSLRRMSGPEGPRRYAVLTLGFVLLAAGHAALGWASDAGRLESGSLWAMAPALGLMFVAVGVLTPDATPQSTPGQAPRVHWTQIFGLLFAALVPLGVLLLMVATGLASRSSSIVVSVSTVAVVALALARMSHLVDQMRTLSEQHGRERLAAMVEHSSDVVVLTGADGRVSYVSPGVRTMLGREPEQWLGRHVTEIVADEERDTVREHVDAAVSEGEGATRDFEASLAHADGHQRKAHVVIANLLGGAALDGIVVTIRDVTEQRNLERQLSHRAFHDELTGLANRALFLDRMDHALRVARPEHDPVVVLFVDLDDFKSVNDQYGHGVGDVVLKTIADRIQHSAGPGDTAARLGGDEFALLLEDHGGIERALDVSESLLELLRDPVAVGGHEVTVLASIGVAVPVQGMSTTGLLRDADIAMYEAKRAGKGQVRIFDPTMRSAGSDHLEFRSDVGDAVERDQLRLVFQPYVDLTTGQVIGAEALVRWVHPERGELTPAEFIPLAERSGSMAAIGDWVIAHALEQATSWQTGLLLGINVSSSQLREPGFAWQIIEMAHEHRVDAATVVLDFNESVLADGDERVMTSVAQLRTAGFRFAIDDFGTGNCSLSVLQRHPVDLLKIDGTTVAQLGSDPSGAALVHSILQSASSLGISTMAEGIETKQQLAELRRLGCTFGQGFLLSPPLPEAEVARRFGRTAVAAVG